MEAEMVMIACSPNKKMKKCPHCGSSFITCDISDREPYCGICGWRRAHQISSEQAKLLFSREKNFWLNRFASETDPDELS